MGDTADGTWGSRELGKYIVEKKREEFIYRVKSMGRHTFIDGLLAEVDEMDESCFQPPLGIQENDSVIGEASTYSRKLWAAHHFYARRVEELCVEARYSDPTEAKKITPQVFIAGNKRDLLAGLAWMCLRTDADHWVQDVGVRRGWKIVNPTAPGKTNWRGRLSHFFGQAGGEDE